MSARHRRDLVLDSGGVSSLASNRVLLLSYLDLLVERFDGAILLPIPVLTEVRTGHRSSDVLLDRLIRALGAEGEMYLPLDVAGREPRRRAPS